MRRTKDEDVVAGIDRVLDLSRRLGLGDEADRSRFRAYRQILQAGERSGDVCAEYEVELSRRNMLLGAASVEGLELALLAGFLETSNPRTIRPKLRAILAGPLTALDEDDASNNARNIMFELVLAHTLSRAGFEVVVGEHPDVQVTVDGEPLLVECKRTLSDKQIRTRTWKACEQLRRQLRQRPRARGLIAISLTKSLNAGDCFLSYTDEERGSGYLADELERVAVESGVSTLRLPENIIGLMFHTMTAAVNPTENGIVHASHINVEVRAPNDTPEYRRVRQLHDALHSMMHAAEDSGL